MLDETTRPVPAYQHPTNKALTNVERLALELATLRNKVARVTVVVDAEGHLVVFAINEVSKARGLAG